MPSSVGPNTFGEENLVFGYDLGDVANSYRGEPTVNLTTDTPLMSGWQGTFTLVDTTSKTFIIETSQANAATTSAWRTYYWSVSAYIGSYVTISADVEFVSQTNCIFQSIAIGQGNTGSFPLHIQGSNALDRVSVSTKPVIKIPMTWSGIINSTGIVGFTQWINSVTANGANSLLRVTNVQIEVKSHATPFINGTRSVTQGLIDLKGTSTIDLSNVSFDSNAQMTFDGTDDILNTVIFGGRNPSTEPFTVEAWVKSDQTVTSRMWIDATSSGTNQRFYATLINGSTSNIGIQGSPWSDSTPNDTNWHHQVIVMDGTTARGYDNGVVVQTKSYSSYTLAGPLNVGGRSGYRWLGDIAMFKVYNRALTSSEVIKNYNAIKGRFNI